MNHLIIDCVLPFGALGGLLGALYFLALGWNVRLYAGGGAGWKAPLLHLARLAAVGAAFILCARQGAAQLLSSFAAFEAVRAVVVNRSGLANQANP